MTNDGAELEGQKKVPHVEARRIAMPDAGDDSAIKEAAQLFTGKSAEELAKEAAENEHGRTERFRDQFENMAICALWVAFSILIFMVITWAAHILLPGVFHWLSEEQLAKVQNLVTGGVVASLAAGHLRKRIGGD